MKKIVTLLLAVCLLASALAGCASSAKTDLLQELHGDIENVVKIQGVVLCGIFSDPALRCSVAFRHFAKLHLIACQVTLAINLYIGRQIVEPIIAIGCRCSRCSRCDWCCTSCHRSSCCYRCSRCNRCAVCYQCKAVILLPCLGIFIIILPGQLDRCGCNAHFVCILNAVVVLVIPDIAFNGRCLNCR